jgi:2-amino-4-hydroxy-6-hydroxymethyldihydropteridine diphosphokinase
LPSPFDTPANSPPASSGGGQGPEPEPGGVVCYLGLGANLGPRAETIAAAVAALEALVPLREVQRSRLFETVAVADHPQPPYLNAVVRGRTTLGPCELLAACLAIEASLGRIRPVGVARAARHIDIDILLHGAAVIDTPSLRVPHPELLNRPFVRIPLAEVAAPGLVHPRTGEALDLAAPAPAMVQLWQGVWQGSGTRSNLPSPSNPEYHALVTGGSMSEGHSDEGPALWVERRRAHRIPLEMWVEETTENERYFRRAGDLSRGGMRLDYTIPLPRGTLVNLTFTLPGDSRPVVVTGEIVSNGGAEALRMGVKFVNLLADSQAQIDAFLARVAADSTI